MFFKREKSAFYKEDPILSISKLVEWKRSRKSYNFSSLPKTAILTINKNAFSGLIHPFKKRVRGLKGSHYIYDSNYLLCSEFGMGSSAMIAFLEEIKELGVEKIIFIGVAGIISNAIVENNVFCISSVFSSVGSSYFYCEEEELNVLDEHCLSQVCEILKIGTVISWSTDCPFRETLSLVNHYKSVNAGLVDMETAGLYAFSNFHKIPAVSILVGADNFTNNEWEPPSEMKKIEDNIRNVVAKIVKSKL